MTIECRQGDLAKVAADAIVNAANSSLLGGAGVDGAIHRGGGPEILAACKELRATRYPDGLPAGAAVATTAGRLAARWVIHTVGPVHSRAEDRSELLAACYTSSLRVADELGARSIAFPAISTGLYAWPKEDAARIALRAVREATTAVQAIIFVLYGEDSYRAFRTVAEEG
ncbi:O-acetyl-ADP-ribose deacetylase [Microlunatus speluncae]|uniref:O-acetyl-ADP-ribose deacetylase n=1 Tax=Microlunatus speluncae TaxID=2594267 RepID=UPI00126680C0|nr:O-acetyl-ADP-ribose deacetylase [Microlunatus speluncae]